MKKRELARAAELLLRYAAVVRDCHSSHELERFDYLPEIEEAAENVLAAARLAQPYAKDDAGEQVSHTAHTRDIAIEECARMVNEYNEQSETGDTLTTLATNMRAMKKAGF